MDFLTHSPGSVKNIILTRQSSEVGVSGSGELVSVDFSKGKNGITDVKLDNFELSDSNGNLIEDFNIYYLILWDDTNNALTKVGENVRFFASLSDSLNNPVTNANCQITVGSQQYAMRYDNNYETYIYDLFNGFQSPGLKIWSVTCLGYYEVTDTAIVSECIPNEIRDCYGGQPETAGVGICRYGKETCESTGVWEGVCEDQVLPQSEEVCDTRNLDENCDGQSNKKSDGSALVEIGCYTGPAGTKDIGICKAGIKNFGLVTSGRSSAGSSIDFLKILDYQELFNLESIDGFL